MDDDLYDPRIDQVNDRQGAQVIQIDSSKHVQAITVCAVICGMSVVAALVAGIVAWNAQTYYQITLNHVKDLEAAQRVQHERLEDLAHEQRR